jgi:hypothetical protein
MSTTDQRLDAAKLARQLNAPKTLAILNDDTKNSPIDSILKTAVDEVGLDKVASVILENDYPYWAIGAIRYLPNLGKYEAALREKAKIVQISSAEQGSADILTASSGGGLVSINTFEMYLACGVGYAANYFSMWYFTPPFSNFWNKSNNRTGSAIVCQSQIEGCSFFSIPETPLKSGDTVMMMVSILAGINAPTNIWFTYDPNSKHTAEIDCYGTTLVPSFTYAVRGN